MVNLFKKLILNQTFYLIIIIVVGLFLRVYQLGVLPVGIYCDEAANGYDAYSLLKTSQDLYGRSFPLFFNHHNIDWVEPLYVYPTTLLVYIFGLNIFSARLLAAIIGTLTILTTYLVTKELLNNKNMGLLAAMFIAVSPWHLHFSRLSFRGIYMPLFVTLGLFFFLKSLKNYKWLIPTAATWAISLYSHVEMKLFIPLLILTLLIFYWREIKLQLLSTQQYLKHFIISTITFLIITTPIYYLTLTTDLNKRFEHISIFTRDENPMLLFMEIFMYHLDPWFLFWSGDQSLRYNIAESGQVSFFLIPLIFIAITYYFYGKEKKYILPAVVFLLGLIPVALTTDGIPNPSRTIIAVPWLEITAVAGIFALKNLLEKNNRRLYQIILTIVLVFWASGSVYYLYNYFYTYSPTSAREFQGQMKEVSEYAFGEKDNYDKIVFDGDINQPYIFPLFFLKYNPQEYHRTNKIYNFEFCPSSYIPQNREKCLQQSGNNLIILPSTVNIPKWLYGKPIVQKFYYEDGGVAYIGIKNN